MDKVGSMDRLEKLKLNSIENPGKKKRGCSDCKKKKEINEPLPQIDYEEIWIPTKEDIKLAYAELTSFGGVKEDKKVFINKVHNFLFGDDFDFGCKGCGKNRVRRFTNYMKTL
jgi:hypothetical protein